MELSLFIFVVFKLLLTPAYPQPISPTHPSAIAYANIQLLKVKYIMKSKT